MTIASLDCTDGRLSRLYAIGSTLALTPARSPGERGKLCRVPRNSLIGDLIQRARELRRCNPNNEIFHFGDFSICIETAKAGTMQLNIWGAHAPGCSSVRLPMNLGTPNTRHPTSNEFPRYPECLLTPAQ